MFASRGKRPQETAGAPEALRDAAFPMAEGGPVIEEAATTVRHVFEQLRPPWEIAGEAARADTGVLAAATVPDQPMSPPEVLPRLIDHTLLRPDTTAAEIEQICSEAGEHGFASVCINPRFVTLAASLLRRTHVRVCAVIGFPLGASATSIKAVEAEVAIREGARELDMVLAVGALKGGALGDVGLDIAAIVALAHPRQVLVRVILETPLLSPDEQVRACLLAREAGADLVATSTGFGLLLATAHDVRRLRALVAPTMGVKAAGGIRTRADLERMVRAGATRIGTSSSVGIMREYAQRADAAHPVPLAESKQGDNDV